MQVSPANAAKMQAKKQRRDTDPAHEAAEKERALEVGMINHCYRALEVLLIDWR
jgi:hypothetical protein